MSHSQKKSIGFALDRLQHRARKDLVWRIRKTLNNVQTYSKEVSRLQRKHSSNLYNKKKARKNCENYEIKIQYLNIKIMSILTPSPGQSIVFNHRYLVKKKISSGSFGVVYLGHDKHTLQEVAIKLEKEENEETNSIAKEVQILNILKGTLGVP